MWWVRRRAVPLNTMCSMKCEMPLSSGRSSRLPASSHAPTATERTDGIRSLTTRMPLGSVVRWKIGWGSGIEAVCGGAGI